MGFFSSLFNRKSKQEQELDAIFEKIFNILNNDDLQNNILPDMLKKELDPAPLNTLPDAAGEFGRDPGNPILCNGPLGEVTYLSRLVIPLPKKTEPLRMTFHRLGSYSYSSDRNDVTVDKYELISYDGCLHDILYLDMYHAGKSHLCPKGYEFEDSCSGIRGTNELNSDFPHNQYQCLKECAKNMLGFPAFDTALREFDIEQAVRTINFCNKFPPGSVVWWN